MRFDLSLKISPLPLSFCFIFLSNCLNSHCDLSVMFIFHPCVLLFLSYSIVLHACLYVNCDCVLVLVLVILCWTYITSLLIWLHMCIHEIFLFESIHSLFSSNWIDSQWVDSLNWWTDSCLYKTLLLQCLVHYAH